MQQKSFRPVVLFIFCSFCFSLFKKTRCQCDGCCGCARLRRAPRARRSFSARFFVFVFSFFLFKKGKKRKSGANAMVAAVARGCGARQERAARFPLVFCLLKKLCFSFLLSLFSFFFKKKTVLFFFVVLFLKKNGTVAGRVRRAGLSRIQMPINPTSVVSPLFVSFLLVMCSV